MSKENDGLRERKRRETRKELETATIELVIRDGLEKTTIEVISERANVSARTFFNYFDSKEDALLGFHTIDVDDDLLGDYARNHPGATIVESIVGLMLNFIGPSLIDKKLYTSRRKIIKRYPQLLERQFDRIAHATSRFAKSIQRMATSSKNIEMSEAEAEILLVMCSSSVRVAIREWAATGKKVSLPDLEQCAIQNVNEVLRKI